MAFYDEEEEQDPNQEGAVQQTGPASSIISGSGAGNAPAAGSPDKGGNFVGLQTYLDANKNQAAKLGDQTAGILSNSVNQARDSVSGLNSKFNQQVDENTVTKDDAATGLIGTTPEAMTADQRAQVKKQYGAQYNGPSALSDLGDEYGSALKNANLATQNVQNAQTEEGRGSLISQINSAPRTKGMTSFDNMLLQKGPGRDKLAEVSAQSADVKDLIGNSQLSAQQKAMGAKDTTQKTQSDTYKSVQDALGAWQSGFAPKLANAQKSIVDEQNSLQNDLGDDMYSLDEQNMDKLGLHPGQFAYDVNFNNYLHNASPTDVNASNVASGEDYARYGALADLAGVQDPYLKQENAGLAGTAPKNSIDQDKMFRDLMAAEKASNQKFDVSQTLGDQSHAAAWGLTSPGATDYNGLKNYIDQLNSHGALEWKGGGGGETGSAYRNLVKFIEDMDKNRNPLKMNRQSEKWDPGKTITTLPVR